MRFKIYLDTCEVTYNLTDTFTSECWLDTFIKKKPDDASISIRTKQKMKENTPKLITELENLIEYLIANLKLNLREERESQIHIPSWKLHFVSHLCS